MENKSSNGWKFFALLFGALLAGVVGLYIYKQQNPDYDPWEEPWENSSSPVDLGLNTTSFSRFCLGLFRAILGFPRLSCDDVLRVF